MRWAWRDCGWRGRLTTSAASTAILAVLREARAASDHVLLAEALSVAHHCHLGPS